MSGYEFSENQPDSFEFTLENLAAADTIIARYPPGRQASAVIPLLDLAQRQHDNWLPRKAIEVVAEKLGMAPIRVLEVATFYTMFNLKPVGRYFLQVCKTTPCWLRGSDEVLRCIRDRLGIDDHGTTEDGMFSLLEVECLGACVNAPILQVNDDFYEDLDYEKTGDLLTVLMQDAPPPPGSMAGRNRSESSAGATTLTGLRANGADYAARRPQPADTVAPGAGENAC